MCTVGFLDVDLGPRVALAPAAHHGRDLKLTDFELEVAACLTLELGQMAEDGLAVQLDVDVVLHTAVPVM